MPQLLPVPDRQGIERVRALYRERFGREITAEQAADVLGRVMRLLFLLSDGEGRTEGEAAPAEETGISPSSATIRTEQ